VSAHKSCDFLPPDARARGPGRWHAAVRPACDNPGAGHPARRASKRVSRDGSHVFFRHTAPRKPDATRQAEVYVAEIDGTTRRVQGLRKFDAEVCRTRTALNPRCSAPRPIPMRTKVLVQRARPSWDDQRTPQAGRLFFLFFDGGRRGIIRVRRSEQKPGWLDLTVDSKRSGDATAAQGAGRNGGGDATTARYRDVVALGALWLRARAPRAGPEPLRRSTKRRTARASSATLSVPATAKGTGQGAEWDGPPAHGLCVTPIANTNLGVSRPVATQRREDEKNGGQPRRSTYMTQRAKGPSRLRLCHAGAVETGLTANPRRHRPIGQLSRARGPPRGILRTKGRRVCS